MVRRDKLSTRLRSAREGLHESKSVIATPKPVIARPKAVAIHGFMDCRVASASRSDGLVQC
jgi:hypothetical protein